MDAGANINTTSRIQFFALQKSYLNLEFNQGPLDRLEVKFLGGFANFITNDWKRICIFNIIYSNYILTRYF